MARTNQTRPKQVETFINEDKQVPPLIRRTRTISDNDFQDEVRCGRVTPDNGIIYIPSEDEKDEPLEEEKEETKEEIPQSPVQHLQQGVLAVFYQNEHHTKLIIEKVNTTLEAITKKLDEMDLKLQDLELSLKVLVRRK